MKFNIPNIGVFDEKDGFVLLEKCNDNFHEANKNGVKHIVGTKDKKIEFICYENHTLCYVLSSVGYSSYYPVYKNEIKKPIKAVLMDLDGTSVRSEEFWIWIIEKTVCSLLNDDTFRFKKEDLPFVSGNSVSEHLQYCIDKYCPDKTLKEAREYYFQHTYYEMNEIMEGRGKENAFTPTKGLKKFLLTLKKNNIKIGLVTSGLYEKAWPEIISAFDSLKLGNPKKFYDCAITAGYPLKKGETGTLGELSPKPHPWLYAETGCVGLNIPFKDRNHVVGIEDSGAGIVSILLAGYTPIGISGGNIETSGTKKLCKHYVDSFDEILNIIL